MKIFIEFKAVMPFQRIVMGLIVWICCGNADFLIAQENQPNMLIEAIRRGELQQAEAFIEQGMGLETGDVHGRTALMWGAFKGELGLVKQMIFQGADIEAKDREGKTPLIYAALGGNANIVESFIRSGAELDVGDYKGKTALIHAAVYGKTAAVKILLNNGADSQVKDHNGMTALRLIEFKNYPKIVVLLQQSRNKPSHKNSVLPPKMEQVKKTPLSISKKQFPPLRKKHPEEKIRRTGQEGILIQAAIEGNQEIVRSLIASGAYINARDTDGMTALMWAARYNHLKIVQLLIGGKVNVDLKEYKYNWTALMWAGRYGHTMVVKLLIEAGADVHARDKYDWTVLEIALAHYQKETVHFLENLL